MKAYFAVGDSSTAIRLLAGHRALISFAYVGSSFLPTKKVSELASVTSGLMIDSGAFTAWRKGSAIQLDAYSRFLLTAPVHEWAIALDVIGDAEASVANWRLMRQRHPTIVPVWHEGDPVSILDEYASAGGLIGLGRIEGRRSDQKTLEFYDAAFNRHPDTMFHALGNANPMQLEPYPFYSFDSTGWQRDAAYSQSHKWPYNRCTKETRMRASIEATETIEHRAPKQQPLFHGMFSGGVLLTGDRP